MVGRLLSFWVSAYFQGRAVSFMACDDSCITYTTVDLSHQQRSRARGERAENMSRDHKPELKSERTRIHKAGMSEWNPVRYVTVTWNLIAGLKDNISLVGCTVWVRGGVAQNVDVLCFRVKLSTSILMTTWQVFVTFLGW